MPAWPVKKERFDDDDAEVRVEALVRDEEDLRVAALLPRGERLAGDEALLGEVLVGQEARDAAVVGDDLQLSKPYFFLRTTAYGRPGSIASVPTVSASPSVRRRGRRGP